MRLRRHQFQNGEAVRFRRTGDVAVVERVARDPHRNIMVWLRFPDCEPLVPYPAGVLRDLADLLPQST